MNSYQGIFLYCSISSTCVQPQSPALLISFKLIKSPANQLSKGLLLTKLTIAIQALLLDPSLHKTNIIHFVTQVYFVWAHVCTHMWQPMNEDQRTTLEVITSLYFVGTGNTNMGMGLVGNKVCSQRHHASSSRKALILTFLSSSPNIPSPHK